MKKIIIITGQTATGKTKYALDLALKENGELINFDSRQVYKYLDIITGKDIKKISNIKNQKSKFCNVNNYNGFDIGYYCFSRSTLHATRCAKIWLYDVVDPKEYFSSYDYQQCALFVIKKLLNEGKTPILIGGTYFYLKHLLYGVGNENNPPNFDLRKDLNEKSLEELQTILKKISPELFESMNQSDRNNSRRLIRKIEILNNLNATPLLPTKSGFEGQAGKPRRLTEYLAQKLSINNLEIDFHGFAFKNKEDLIKTISKRVQERIDRRAFDEVANLLQQDYSANDPGLKTIGYQQIIQYINGRLNKQEAINQWITKEIQYAKRQMTFMKKDKNIKWKYV